MWKTPKTNWKTGDFYNLEDWQRLAQNTAFLAALAKEKGAALTLQPLAEYDRSDVLRAADCTLAEKNYAAARSFVTGESHRPTPFYAGSRFWSAGHLNDMEAIQLAAKQKLESL